jgi:peptide/nickel transport system substrate-binding protein
MKPRLLAASAAAALAFCGASVAATPLRISITSDIRSTEPGVNRDANTDAFLLHIVEGLVAYGEDAEIKPLLADSWSVSPDGKVYTFKLRSGVTFQNGAPLTSADVLWSWKFFNDPKTGWRCATDFDGHGSLKVVSVEAPDAQTVVYTLDKANGLFLGTLARTDCGGAGVVHRDSVKADGSWDKPIGTGPFKLGEWKRGEFISLLKYDKYANRGGKRDGFAGSKRPLVDEVRFMVVPDESTAKAALARGNIDVIQDLSYSDVKTMEKTPHVKVAHAPVMSMTALLIQTQDPVMANLKLRQAIAAAIDYKQLAEAVTEGLAQPNNSVVPLVSSYYGTVEKQGWTYDPALAQKLLKESGYQGQPITMYANKRYPQSYNSAVIIQAMLQAVGITVKLEVNEWATQLDRYNAGKYQMMTFPYSARLDPASNFETVSGDKTKQPRKIWDNPKALALLDQATLESDHAKRQQQFDDLHRMFIADVPSIPLYNGLDIGAFRDNIVGYTPWAVKQPRAWEVEKKE